MGAVVLDASVLIGLLDRADAHHPRAVKDVEAADESSNTLLAPASAYSETLVAFSRARRVPDARRALRAMGVQVVPLTEEIAVQAAEIRVSHSSLRLPDALVLATARAHAADLLTYRVRLKRAARAG